MSSVDLQVPKLAAHQQIYGNPGGFNDLKKTAREDQKEALRPVAEQFEALFVAQILKEARKVKFDDGFLDGGQGDFYKDWYDQQLSQILGSKGSLGLADKIVEDLAPKLPTMSKEDYRLYLEQKNQAAGLAENAPPQQKPLTTADSLAIRQLQQRPLEE